MVSVRARERHPASRTGWRTSAGADAGRRTQVQEGSKAESFILETLPGVLAVGAGGASQGCWRFTSASRAVSVIQPSGGQCCLRAIES